MHDVNGKPLKVGDEVVLRAKITSLCEGVSTYCNVNIESVHGMPTGMLACVTCRAVCNPEIITAGNHVTPEGAACFGELKPHLPKQSFSSVNTKMLEKAGE